MQSQVKVAGLTACALTSLDSLDFEGAEGALTELGHPTENDALYADEFWAFTVYARSQFALSCNDAFSALSLLRRTVAAHSAQCNPTSIAQPLMQSAEMDLLLALGEGNMAASLAGDITDPGSSPWTLVSVARVRQRMGQNRSAIALCHQYNGDGQPYPRAQMESLLIQAVAHWGLGEQQDSVDAWSRACTIADQNGLLRSFATVAALDIENLESAAATHSPALTEFLKTATREVFPKSVHIVTLTERERKVLLLLAAGMSSTAMSEKLHVSTNTVKSQLRSVYKKLDAHNRDEAIAQAHALRFI
ncbi:LuxR C-terminal-related transcriptional regulator [Rhodococcus sp. IEGM 1379]|uniref:LuxR C-terminal-related transcriptional regulator n=1 Tax=Rhodococcus sp. IEGM 1379 TaxID=3047086 RepID=UPI0024B7E140|nr:LuxR C-terminal-related transcriptional regulator [Rhodococcus sp. IEGM 1379]MDI9913804.1 LuxR C-terminal-related transcriptional regulator [Rhodococcus sp. IEGM 1379]